MATPRRCTNCNAEIPDDSPAGLCRRCLLRLSMEELDETPSLRLRCPRCHRLVKVPEDADLRDSVCTECHGRFSLIDETANIKTTLGRFDLLEVVGSGSFGTVWKARDRQLDRVVVVKVPHRGHLSALEAEQFLREARAAAQLCHPNIVSIHEAGRQGGQVYIVSDYVPGRNLAERLRAEPVTPAEAAELCASIAEALHHAHEAGVIHRDLKPSNVLLDAEGRPHVTDFGLAKREVGEMSMTLEGRVLGTPAYMSPEQARGDSHKADRRADVYSLGVILFELLTGEKPFRGDLQMLLHQVMNEAPPSPRKLGARVPRDLETICLKCLEKDPERRYPSAAAMASDLRSFLAGEPIAARPISALGQLWRWSRRNPREAVLGAAVGGLLLVLAVGGPLVAARQARLASREAAARKQADEDARRVRTIYRTAVDHYTRAFELLEELITLAPEDSKHHRELADIYNDLAWFLVATPDEILHNPTNALELAKLAVRQTPRSVACWRTLAVAQYRLARWDACLETLDRLRALQDASSGPELLLEAMVRWQRGEKDLARARYRDFVRWFDETDDPGRAIRLFRDEAIAMMQLEPARAPRGGKESQ